MRAEKIINALLSGDAGVAAIVGAHVYAGTAPEATKAPLVVYAKQSATREEMMSDGAGGVQPVMVDALIDVLCVAQDYAQLKALAEAVRVALVYRRGDVAGQTLLYIAPEAEGADEYDADLREFAQMWTYRIQHTE